MTPDLADHDERQYEVEYTISDTALFWAGSAEQARDKAEGTGYTGITGVREVADGE